MSNFNEVIAAEPEPRPSNIGQVRVSAGNNSQWNINGNGIFLPTGRTTDILPSGVYQAIATQSGIGAISIPVQSDGLIDLPDMATQMVLNEVETFWNSEEKYRKHNLLYKRGIILYGPPGSGKTVTVKMLMAKIIERGGLVFFCTNTNLTTLALRELRNIEPTRKVVVVLEDVDEIINFNGEASVLSMLDGEHNIDNVLNLATTNYIDRLAARVINRPSRFDRRVEIGMPSADSRRAYFQHATGNNLIAEDLDLWVKETDNMSIAHLRELVASVYCLDQNFTDVVNRLRSMAEPPRSKNDGWKSRSTPGFTS